VGDLEAGQDYEFRVAAVTDAGPGDASKASAAVRAEKPKSRIKFITFFDYHLL